MNTMVDWEAIDNSIAQAFDDGYKQGKADAIKWNMIEKRLMDEEEREYYSKLIGYDIGYEDAFIYSNLPEDGQEVLVCNKHRCIWIDTFEDEEIGCGFEMNGDMDGIIAWMPLPEPCNDLAKPNNDVEMVGKT